MHRSGTSALTRVISLLGAQLPSDLMPPVVGNNEVGFWESMDAYRINDALLAAAGSSWDDWRRFDPSAVSSEAMRDFRAHALGLLQRDFAQSPLFVLKDPRICRFLPLWQDVLTEHQVEVKCVLPLRNPHEVAASLQARDGFEPQKSYLLWLRHALDAEKDTRTLARAFTTYEGLLHDWERSLTALTASLGLVPWKRSPADAANEISAFLDHRHRHHVAAKVRVRPVLPQWVSQAYESLLALALDPHDAREQARLDAVRAEFDRACDAFGPLVGVEETAKTQAQQALATAETRLRDLATVQYSSLTRLERRLGIDSDGIELPADPIAAYQLRVEALYRALEFKEESARRAVEQHERILFRLNAIQTSAAWQLARPLRSAEARYPRLVRGIAAAPKTLAWALNLRLPTRLRLRAQAQSLLSSGLFDLPWYVRRNTDVVLDGLNPILHWLVAGWREGRDPNPLFSIDWYLRQNPSLAAQNLNPLLHYVERGWSEGCEPYPLFDSSWYLKEYPEAQQSGLSPLVHFLRRGATEGHDPSPLLQSDVYREVHCIGCRHVEVLRHFVESGKRFADGAYLHFDVLKSLQGIFRAKTSIRLLGDRRAGPRRFAVYLQCGSGSLHRDWLFGTHRTWDLIVNHYEPAFVGQIPCEIEFQQVGALPGTKFTFVHALLDQWPDIAYAYDYLLLLDDDIHIPEAQISAAFDLMVKHGLDLGQPSLSPDSYGCHRVFRQKLGDEVREVNGVEIMMPLLSRRALNTGGHLFGETISGWGLDLALAKLVRQQLSGRAAVFDGIVARHAKRIDLKEGAFYRMLRRENIHPLLEYRCLQQKYATDRGFFEV